MVGKYDIRDAHRCEYPSDNFRKEKGVLEKEIEFEGK
jgi:hypothetical protein